MTKPPILDVIANRIELRRKGQRWWGLCPFHSEKTPSFTVNESRSFFYCFGCQAKGDVIAFIQKIEDLSFREALARLGIDGNEHKPRPHRSMRVQRAATLLADWMNIQHLRVGALLRELSQDIGFAHSLADSELVESLTCEWKLLSDLHDDLQRPDCGEELWMAKGSIESITETAPLEPVNEFPPSTPEYRDFLAMHLPPSQQAC
jgi:hypothetical protein